MKHIIEQRSLLKHPFYQLWLEGKLPIVALQKYTTQYFQLVAHLPRFISTLHSHCEDEQIRKVLLNNLMEEEIGHGNGNVSHTQLWLDFADELGVSHKEIIDATILPATTMAIKVIRDACDSSLSEGAAALFAYESQVPQISVEKIHGLKKHYNISSEKALRFFEVHKTADIKHGAVWEALAKKGLIQENQEYIAKETANALWEMFDAMYEEYVPKEMMC